MQWGFWKTTTGVFLNHGAVIVNVFLKPTQCSWQLPGKTVIFGILLWFCPDFLIICMWMSNITQISNIGLNLTQWSANVVSLIFSNDEAMNNDDRPDTMFSFLLSGQRSEALVRHELWAMPIDGAARRLIIIVLRSGSASRLIVQPSVGNYLLNTLNDYVNLL